MRQQVVRACVRALWQFSLIGMWAWYCVSVCGGGGAGMGHTFTILSTIRRHLLFSLLLQVFKEEEEAVKVDLHENSGRVKLYWIVALADSKTLKGMVEFRETGSGLWEGE